MEKILVGHKEWLESDGKNGTRADLSLADLSGANLSLANLIRANLRDADLENADQKKEFLRVVGG